MKSLGCLKKWFGKYGAIAPLAAVGLMLSIVVAVVSTCHSDDHNRNSEDGVAAASVAPQPVEVSFEDVQRIAREEIATQRRLDEECKVAWRALLPGIADGALNRWTIALKFKAEIDAMVSAVRNRFDASVYADAICGWQSARESLDCGNAHSRWAMRQYSELVLDENALAERINERLQILHEELTEFDQTLLAELGSEFSSSGVTIDVPKTNLALMTSQFEAMSTMSSESPIKAWVEYGTSYLGGKLLTTVPWVVFSCAGDSSATEQNNAAGIPGDFAADAVATEIVESNIGTARTDLARAAKDWTQMQLTTLLSESGEGVGWLEEMRRLVVNHENTVTEILLADTGADREWAMNLMAAYYNALASQNQEVSND